MKSKKIYALMAVAVSVVFLSFTGCKDKSLKLGQPIPTNLPVVELEKIMKSPSEYNGKNVVMQGTISGQCSSLCEFFFQDGIHNATIFPEGYKFPKLETGKKVKVYASITSGEDNVAFSALGIETE